MHNNPEEFIYDLFSLEGKNAIITGGSQGIGEDLTRTLAMAGANVALANRNVERGESMAHWVRELGRTGRHYPCDVSNKSEVEQMAAAVEKDIGPVDILVNCAGINRLKNALDFTEKEVVDIIHTNLMGVFWCCQAVGRKMVERRRGKVITISSMLSEIAWFQRAPYAASKGGVRQLIRVLSIEWGPYGITVNAIAPGSIKTPMFEKACERDPEFLKKITDLIPMGKPGLPEDHRGALLLLCSKAGDYITGQTLMVDGGLSVDGAHTLRLADEAG